MTSPPTHKKQPNPIPLNWKTIFYFSTQPKKNTKTFTYLCRMTIDKWKKILQNADIPEKILIALIWFSKLDFLCSKYYNLKSNCYYRSWLLASNSSLIISVSLQPGGVWSKGIHNLKYQRSRTRQVTNIWGIKNKKFLLKKNFLSRRYLRISTTVPLNLVLNFKYSRVWKERSIFKQFITKHIKNFMVFVYIKRCMLHV